MTQVSPLHTFKRLCSHRELKTDLFPLALLFLLFLAIDLYLSKVLRFTAFPYENEFLLKSFFLNLGIPGIFLFGIVLVFLGYRKTLNLKWNQLELDKHLRLFVLFLCFLIVWFVVTLDFNHFYNQGYYFDRFMLIAFSLALFWRPIFILPVLLLSFLLLWQLNTLSINYGSQFAHKLQILHVLNLFAAWVLAHSLWSRPKAIHFLFLTGCLIASAYWLPAFKKLKIGWLYSGEISMMLFNSHAHGWLSFLDAASFPPIAEFLGPVDLPMRLLVVGLEAGCLIIAWRRGLTVFLLSSLMIFHMGVFLLYGYFFWTWIALNGAFVGILLTTRNNHEVNFFSHFYLILGIVLILTGKIWCNPSALGWIDGRISYTYRYEVLTGSGNRYDVPFDFFEPYGDVFTMANFTYLTDSHQFLSHPYGSTSHQQAEALLKATNRESVEALEESIGWEQYSLAKSKTFQNFVQTYFSNKNSNSDHSIPYLLGPPRQFWTHPRGDVYTGQEPAKTVIVNEVTTLFDGSALKEIRTVEIMKILIPDSDPPLAVETD